MRTLTRTLAAAGLAAVLVCSLTATALPVGASQESDAGAAIEKYLEVALAGDWAKAYTLLPAAQRDLFDQAEWEACETQRNGQLVGAELLNFKVASSKKEQYEIPGTDEKLPALAVKIKITVKLDGKVTQEDDTVHVVHQGKRWRTALSQDHIDACLGR